MQPDADHLSLDQRTFIALRTRFHFQPLETALKYLSISGNYGLIWVGLALVFWLTGSWRGLPMAIFTPLFVYLTLLVNYLIKEALHRERPVSDDPRLQPLVGVPSSKSFPSSHAAMSFAAASVMTIMKPELWPLFFGLALLVSWTRVYVGVHYPSDVLAGTAVGLAMGLVAVEFFNFF